MMLLVNGFIDIKFYVNDNIPIENAILYLVIPNKSNDKDLPSYSNFLAVSTCCDTKRISFDQDIGHGNRH